MVATFEARRGFRHAAHVATRQLSSRYCCVIEEMVVTRAAASRFLQIRVCVGCVAVCVWERPIQNCRLCRMGMGWGGGWGRGRQWRQAAGHGQHAVWWGWGQGSRRQPCRGGRNNAQWQVMRGVGAVYRGMERRTKKPT